MSLIQNFDLEFGKSKRQQRFHRRKAVYFVRSGKENRHVVPRKGLILKESLTAGAARSRWPGGGKTIGADGGYGYHLERYARIFCPGPETGRTLGACARRISHILLIGAGSYLAVRQKDSGSDMEIAVRRVRAFHRRAGGIDKTALGGVEFAAGFGLYRHYYFYIFHSQIYFCKNSAFSHTHQI